MATDRDALICDMAETYGIYDLWSLPVDTIATLACGLRESSRIMLKLSGASVSNDTFILADAADSLRLLAWAKTVDGQKNKNRPDSLVDLIVNGVKQKETEGYSSAEEFEAAREKFLKGGD